MAYRAFQLLEALLSLQINGEPQHENHFIVGGNDAPIHRYTNYTVALFSEEAPMLCEDRPRPFCGGALIAPNWILTAAHCETYLPETAIIGRYDFDDESDDSYEEIKILNRIPHPQYGTSSILNDYDFMLLELESESNHIPIKIDDGTLDLEGSVVTALGWGYSGDGIFDKQPAKLQTVDLDYVPNDQCQLTYIFPFMQTISSRMMCARRILNGVCYADSGGPLIVRNEDTESDVLVGVTSFNIKCNTAFNSVFARVGSVTSWITEHVDDLRINNPDE